MEEFKGLDGRAMLRLVPGHLMVLSADLIIVLMSDFFISKNNLDDDDLYGKKIGSAFQHGLPHADHYPNLKDMEDWFSENSLNLRQERHREAFERSFNGCSYTIFESADENRYSIILNLNLTEAPQAQSTSLDQELTLQMMAEDTDILISIVDCYGILEYRNPAWDRFLGDSIIKSERFKWDSMIHPEDLETFQDILFQSIHSRSHFSAEFRMMDSNKQYRWLKVRGTPRLNAQQRFQGYVCSAIEITDLKHQITKLAEVNRELQKINVRLSHSEENLQAAFDAAEMGSSSVHIPTGRVEISSHYRELYGLPSSGNLNWDILLSAVDPEYHAEVNRVLMNAALLGSPVDSTYPIKHLKTGERKWMRVTGIVRRDDDGKPESVYAVVMEVTKKIEEELRKNEFIAMVSHELKTPLTSINGYLQLLKHKADKKGDYSSLPVFGKIQMQVQKMVKMINDFLSVSRLESGKLMIDRKPFAVGDLIREIQEEFVNDISTHHFIIECKDDFNVDADKDKLAQVIHNFLSNAIKYSPIGSIIKLNCKSEDGEMRLSVIDQGMGVDRSDFDKLFDRYYRSENSKVSTIAGFGIGLYLCKQIITLHGGRIWAKPGTEGIGTEFTFSLKHF